MSITQNLVEKISQRFAVDGGGLPLKEPVRALDYIDICPAYVMTHDNTGAVIPKFRSIGAATVARPRQIVVTLDHNVQDKGRENQEKYAEIERFAREQHLDFYPAGRGIGHQIMCEEGYAWPHTLVVASDSHSNMYGGLGCLGTPVTRTDAAAIWVTGRTWWQVPPVARVELCGKLQAGVSGKDVIVALCGLFNHDEVLNHAVEFVGAGVGSLSVDQRLTVANMTTEWGALAGLFPCDGLTREWLFQRARAVAARSISFGSGNHPRLTADRVLGIEPLASDPSAHYAKELELDLGTIEPLVSGPNSVKVATPLSTLETRQIRIHKAYLVSCVNSRVSDIAEAAAVVRGRRVAEGVSFYVSAASSEVQAQSEAQGDWDTLLAAGAIPLPPGCGPCIGLGTGTLEAGEVGISSTNRNFKGRMGSPLADCYLASPAVVAASAVAGHIAGPHPSAYSRGPGQKVVFHVKQQEQVRMPSAVSSPVEIIEGFASSFAGEIIFCHADNLNTDGIFPSKYTYQDRLSAGEQAAVAMENYDPSFRGLVKTGDILIGGYNFGTGSSREQAATCLKHCGLRLVLAGSFSETFKRNALNNGFLAIAVPGLVADLKRTLGTSALTLRPGLRAEIDFRRSLVRVGASSYPISPIGRIAQELVLVGGLGAWIRLKRSGVPLQQAGGVP